MATLLEELIENIGTDAAEGAEIGAQTASEVVDETILDGANVASEGVEGGGKIGEEVEQGINESQQEIKDVVSKVEKGEAGAAAEAGALEGKWAQALKNVWANRAAFGNFVGKEVLKGALFYAGMKAVEAAYTAAFPPSSGNSGGGTASDSAVNQITTINKAGPILKDALTTWVNWQAAHYDDRATYGTVNAGGIDIDIFQILQSTISSLGDDLNKMTPLVTAANKTKSADAMRALFTAYTAYAQRMVDLSAEIASKMTAMVNAGLPTKSAEVQAAYTMLLQAASA